MKNKIKKQENSLCIQNMEIRPAKNNDIRMVYCRFFDDHLYRASRFYKPIMRELIVVFIMFFAFPLLGQNDLKSPYAVAKEDGFSYRSLEKLIGMDSLYVGSKFEAPYHDLMSILYSRVGHYTDAMRMAEKGSLFSDKTRLAKTYENVITIPLSEVMDSIIENNRVIIENEKAEIEKYKREIESLKSDYENRQKKLDAIKLAEQIDGNEKN